jgi:hypothetical protein
MAFSAPELYEMLDIWKEMRGGRDLPRKSDMSPLVLKDHLGWIVIAKVRHDPLSFQFTLYGTKITEIVKRDVTGMYLEEAFSGEALRQTRAMGEQLVREKKPIRMHSTVVAQGMEFLNVQTIFLPLSDDGVTVNTLLARQAFLNL